MAQVDYFLKLEFVNAGNVKGEATATGHEDEIQIDSFSWGETNIGTFGGGTGGGAGKVNMQDLTCSKRMDKASSILSQSCATGDHMKTAILSCRKAGGTQEDFLTITLEEGFVTSYQV